MLSTLVVLICSVILIPIDRNYICDHDCWNMRTYIILLMFLILRFVSSLIAVLIYIYILELYPTEIVILGMCFTTVLTDLAAAFTPYLVTLLNQTNIPVISSCAVASLLLIVAFVPLR